MAATARPFFRRARWSDGRAARHSIDRTAAVLWGCAIAARATAVSLVWFASLSKVLLAMTIDAVLLFAANLRLHKVIKRRETLGELDQPAPAMWRRWLARYYTRVVVRGDAKADRLTMRASVTEDRGKAWSLRHKADRERRWADKARDLVDHWS